jgi:hypothetical protein
MTAKEKDEYKRRYPEGVKRRRQLRELKKLERTPHVEYLITLLSYTRACRKCGSTFITHYGDKVYCSHECRNYYNVKKSLDRKRERENNEKAAQFAATAAKRAAEDEKYDLG